MTVNVSELKQTGVETRNWAPEVILTNQRVRIYLGILILR